MYFHKPQEKPRRWGSFQDVQYAIRKNAEKIYQIDPDSIVLCMPLFWGLPPLDYSGKNNHGTNYGATYKDGGLDFDGSNDYISSTGVNEIDGATELSLCVWVKHSSLTDDDYICQKGDGSDGFLFFRDDVGITSGRTDIYTIFVAESAGPSTKK